MYRDPTHEEIKRILKGSKTIAVVGLSDKPERSSYSVADYLLQHYTVVPVNPSLKEWRGLPAYPSLSDVPEHVEIDVVDIFRRSEAVPEIVEQAIARGGVKCVWMQQGVLHKEAAEKATAAGITTVMDSCIAVVHAQIR